MFAWLNPILLRKSFICTLIFSTWVSSVNTSNFCPDGSQECSDANLPRCQDRTIQCQDQLPVPDGLVQTYIENNETLNDHSFGSKYKYTCKNSGILCKYLFGFVHTHNKEKYFNRALKDTLSKIAFNHFIKIIVFEGQNVKNWIKSFCNLHLIEHHFVENNIKIRLN